MLYLVNDKADLINYHCTVRSWTYYIHVIIIKYSIFIKNILHYIFSVTDKNIKRYQIPVDDGLIALLLS